MYPGRPAHPELSSTDIPSDVEREYRDFIVAALQYLTANSPTGTEARGGLHFAYQLAPDNRYEAYALGLFEGTLISHVDFFNDWRSGHDEMGALSYTFVYKGRPLRTSIAMPAKASGVDSEKRGRSLRC